MPKQFGRYQVITGLGKGGMARVYLAVQRGPFGATKLVVIKQLRPDVADDELLVSQFADEARIALRLSHPNVVHTYDVVVEPEEHYLAMEFLEGLSLSEILRRVGYDALPLDLQLWGLTQVLAGLHYAHELCDFDGTPLHIVHRDVSPSNVFVTYAGEVKLLDFGIAKANNALSSTQIGLVKGKIGYAAPEQLHGQAVDARTDVYAVGIMLWEAMAGRRRWSRGTYLARLAERLEYEGPPIEEVWPEVPPPLARICNRALSSKLAERHSSALELKQELDAYIASSSPRVGFESIAAFMTDHFLDDAIALRHKITEAMDAFAQRSRSESPPLAPPDESETGKPTMRHSPATRLSPVHRWVLPMIAVLTMAAIALVGIGVRSRGPQGSSGRSSSPIWVQLQSTAATPATGTPSAVIIPELPQGPGLEAALASAPNAGARASQHEPMTTPSPRHPTREIGSNARRKVDGLRDRAGGAESFAPATPPLPETAVHDDHPQESDQVEPGMDLRLRGSTHVKGTLDEKDPYAP